MIARSPAERRISHGTRAGAPASPAPVIESYESLVVRAYCHARFRIINRRFLGEILQLLPQRGSVLELGCGFGLFSLYFARELPGVDITGVDINAGRIASARSAAE